MAFPIHDELLARAVCSLGLIDQATCARVSEEALARGASFASVLEERGVIAEEELGKLVAELLGVPFVRLATTAVDIRVASRLPSGLARMYEALPFGETRAFVQVAMHNPTDREVTNLLEKRFVKRVQPFFVTRRDLLAAQARLAEAAPSSHASLEEHLATAQTALRADEWPVAHLVEALLRHASDHDATELHLEPREDGAVIRLRVDGRLVETHALSKKLHQLLIERLTEQDRPTSPVQAGERIFLRDGMKIPVHVSLAPHLDGEKVSLRLLSEKPHLRSLDQLGLHGESLKSLYRALERSTGLVVIVGPRGSGKTTTLYAAIHAAAAQGRSVATVEDRVAYEVPGVRQIETHAESGFTTEKAIASALREDPDVLVVGHARDGETIGQLLDIALTGRLVLTTVTASDVATVQEILRAAREAAPHLSSVPVILVVQRLGRTNCPQCLVVEEATVPALQERYAKKVPENFFSGKERMRFFQSKGCATCAEQGHGGQRGLFEIVDEQAATKPALSLWRDGLAKASVGEMSIDELVRVLSR